MEAGRLIYQGFVGSLWRGGIIQAFLKGTMVCC